MGKRIDVNFASQTLSSSLSFVLLEKTKATLLHLK